MSSSVHVFNQYYFDFLKKLKNIAKPKKDTDKDARIVLRSIKKNYPSYDKLSTEYKAKLQELSTMALNEYASVENNVETLDKWLDENAEVSLYIDIPVNSVRVLLNDTLLLHHFLTIFATLSRDDVSDEDIVCVLDVAKSLADKDLADKVAKVQNEAIKNMVNRIVYLYELRVEKAKTFKPSDSLNGIENTSLGKLAKEILDEVNVDDLQNSLGDGDIMKALANPDGGLMKLLGTVSQKMVSKMSSGELRQDTLLTEAMQFASQLGNAVPPELKNIGNLASMFGAGAQGNPMEGLSKMFGGGGGDDEDGGFNMDMITNMMKTMMPNAPRPAGMHGAKAKVNPNIANQQMRRTVMARQMRKKLEQKKEAKENVPGHVEVLEDE